MEDFVTKDIAVKLQQKGYNKDSLFAFNDEQIINPEVEKKYGPLTDDGYYAINGEKSSVFPAKTSNYTPTGVSCTNNATAKFDYVDWIVEADAKNTTCTVDFEENKNSHGRQIR